MGYNGDMDKDTFIGLVRKMQESYRPNANVQQALQKIELVALIGPEQAAYRLEVSTRKQAAIEDGFLRPTHIFGVKPPGR